jgi:histidine triad (HIT) family protein
VDMVYNVENVFAKIIRGDIPCEKVYEDEFTLAFHDINPRAPVHVVVIPKGSYVSFADFSANGSPEEIYNFFQSVGKIAEELNLLKGGYRILANHGQHAGQEVPHFHMHIFAGRHLGPMLVPVE